MQDSPSPSHFIGDPHALARSVVAHPASAAVDVAGDPQHPGRTAGAATLGKAQGILMERFGIDADLAFDVLQRASRNSHRNLRAVVEDLMEGPPRVEPGMTDC